MLGSRRLIIQRAVTRLTRSGGSRPELRLLDAAAQAGIVSRPFKGIICDDISEIAAQERAPSLGGRPGSLDHVLRDTGLSDFKAEFEQLAMDTGGAPQWIVSAHPRISARRSASTCGRPPRERDFHRQYRRKPARCQRTRVSGRMIVMALRIDGNHRYSMIKNKRSPFVSWTRPLTLPSSTTS